MASRIPLNAAEESRLLAAISHWPLRDQLLVEFGLSTGFRAHELCSVRVGQVWDGTAVFYEVTVSRRNLKGGCGVRRRAIRSRTVPLGDRLRANLNNYLRSRRDHQGGQLLAVEPLFKSAKSTAPGGSITPWTINYLVKGACRLAGLPANGRYGSHSLRKSFAQRIYRSSGNNLIITMMAMNHSDVRVTQRYLPVEADEVRSAILAAQGA